MGKSLSGLVRYLHRITDAEAVALPDRELLERYLGHGDEAAFELLVWRHGGMVLNVCRRILQHEQDAEDAFQAVFLMLVRKARSIRQHQAVAGWLYRVAFRIALEARERARRRASREKPAIEPLPEPNPQKAGWQDLRPILDEEVNRLPERFRLPLILCYLEGKTNQEAARMLGCPAGTIFSRLARGRELLRRRLVRRGLAVPAAGLGTLLGENALAASPAPVLVHAAIRNALLFASGQAAGVSTSIVSLAEGVFKAMFLKKIKLAVVCFLLLGFLVGGGIVTHRALLAAPKAEAKNEKPPVPKVPRLPGDIAVMVTVTKPVSAIFDQMTKQPGSLQAFEWVDLYPPVPGILKKQKLDIGDKVKEGDLLCEIDAPDLVIEARKAELNLEIARGKLLEAQAKVATAKAELIANRKQIDVHKKQVESSKAFLEWREKEFKRYKELAAKNAIDIRLVEEASPKLKAAEAQLIASELSLEKAQADVIVKQAHIEQNDTALKINRAQVKLAELNLEKAQVYLGFTKVRSPYDGVVGQRNFHNGSFVKGNSPLLTIYRMDLMRMVVQVPSRDASYLKEGAAAEIVFASLPNLKITGKVNRIAAHEDPTTHTVRTEIDLVNDKRLFRPGMYGEVTIKLGKKSHPSLTIPSSCLVSPKILPPSKAGEAAVYVLHDHLARLTKIHIGQQSGGRVEVLSGLNPEDQVVADPERLPLESRKAEKNVPVKVRK